MPRSWARCSQETGRKAEGLHFVFGIFGRDAAWQGCWGWGGCFKKPGDHLSLSVFWLVFDEPNNINKWTVFAKVVLLHF